MTTVGGASVCSYCFISVLEIGDLFIQGKNLGNGAGSLNTVSILFLKIVNIHRAFAATGFWDISGRSPERGSDLPTVTQHVDQMWHQFPGLFFSLLFPHYGRRVS